MDMKGCLRQNYPRCDHNISSCLISLSLSLSPALPLACSLVHGPTRPCAQNQSLFLLFSVLFAFCTPPDRPSNSHSHPFSPKLLM